MHPSVAGALRVGRRGRGSSCGLPFPCLSSHLYCFMPSTGPSDLLISSFLWGRHCPALSCQKHIPVGGVPHSALSGLELVCPCSPLCIHGLASPGNTLAPCSEPCHGSPVPARSSPNPWSRAFPAPGISTLRGGECGLWNQARWVECWLCMTLSKSLNFPVPQFSPLQSCCENYIGSYMHSA